MKRRSLLKVLAVSSGNIALPIPIFTKNDAAIIIGNEKQKKSPVYAKTVKNTQDSTLFTFTVGKGVRYSHFHLDSPDRFVIDFYNAGIFGIDNLKIFSNALISRVRVGHPDATTARIVFDMKAQARMETKFFDDILGSHLTINISPEAVGPVADKNTTSEKTAPKPETESAPAKAEPPVTKEENQPEAAKAEIENTTDKSETENIAVKSEAKAVEHPVPKAQPVRASRPTRKTVRNSTDRIIVIDPGHGGIDPGTIGANGTKEKDVVLEVAKRLQERLNSIDGYQAHLTRDDDRFLTLKKRVSIVQEHKANLAISLHVDAFHDPTINGASVYCLKEHSNLSDDPFVRELVKKENGVDLTWSIHTDDSLSRSLEMLRMNTMHRLTLFNARIFAKKLLKSMAKSHMINLQYNRLKQADFFILKTPAIPSALVELGFLSNPNDERLVKDESYQDHLSMVLSQGVSHYLHLA